MKRPALTLVELLVVITIIVVLLAALAPVFRAGLEERKLAEATRGLSGIIMKAKAMAAESGRPVGIALERLDASDPNGNPIGAMQSIQVYIVEVPIPYTGDMDDATCLLRDMNQGVGPDGQWGVAGVDDSGTGTADDLADRGAPGSDDGDGMPETATFDPSLGSQGASVLINPGDLIRFNFRGPFYRVVQKIPRSAVQTDIVFSHPETVWANGVNGVFDGGLYGSDDVWVAPPAPQAAFRTAHFQVYRAPTRTLAQPYNMPIGTAIDLSVSGLGTAGGEFGTMNPLSTFGSPVVIMFNPTGEVESIYQNGARFRAQQPIHLLVGQSDLVNPPDRTNLLPTLRNVIDFDDANGDGLQQPNEDAGSNLMAGNRAKWVTIGHRNGLVTVNDNDVISLNLALGSDPLKIADAITQARTAATESQTYGGR